MSLVDEYTATQRYVGNLPLHSACAIKTMTTETMVKILRSYPQAILEESGVGSPFQIILRHKPALVLFDTMVEVWADQSGTDRDESWRTILRHSDIHGMLPLHVAIRNRAPADLILKMIEKYPDSVKKAIKSNGHTPLHDAAFNGCSLEVLEALLKYDPTLIGSRRGLNKNTPLHLLFHFDCRDRWVKKEEGVIPPHEMARYIIKIHAFEDKKWKGNKGKKHCPETVAKTLVSETKNATNDTVLDYVNQLKEKLSTECPEELLALLHWFTHFCSPVIAADAVDAEMDSNASPANSAQDRTKRRSFEISRSTTADLSLLETDSSLDDKEQGDSNGSDQLNDSSESSAAIDNSPHARLPPASAHIDKSGKKRGTEIGSRVYAEWENGEWYFAEIVNIKRRFSRYDKYSLLFYDGDFIEHASRKSFDTREDYKNTFHRDIPRPPKEHEYRKRKLMSSQKSPIVEPPAPMTLEEMLKNRCNKCVNCTKENCGRCASCTTKRSTNNCIRKVS
jgi:ankyrin repeat protein